MADAHDSDTVNGVSEFNVTSEQGTFTLYSRFRPDQCAQLAERIDPDWHGADDDYEDYVDTLDDDFLTDMDDDGDGRVIVNVHGCHLNAGWWFTDTDAHPENDPDDNHDSCHCGRVTLIDVLDATDENTHQHVIDAHLRVQRHMWNHFWSAEAVLLGDERLGDVCVDCLLDGPDHVVELQTDVETLSIELGEALATFPLHIHTVSRPHSDGGSN